MLMHILASALAILWAAIVVLGLLGKRRGAAIAAGMTAVAASVPFAPRVLAYLSDRDGFVIRYGAAAIDEVVIGAVCVTFGLLALITAPLAATYAWGWLPPALSSLPPVALFVWLVFWFRIVF